MPEPMYRLNWTKVGLKAKTASKWYDFLIRLNWTKVGLKARYFTDAEYADPKCLNWTKVGLKVVTPRGTMVVCDV